MSTNYIVIRNSHVLVFIDRVDFKLILILFLCAVHAWHIRFAISTLLEMFKIPDK